MKRLSALLALAWLAGLSAACASGPWQRSTGERPAAVDIAIITILDEEYDAVVAKLASPSPVPDAPDDPNLYEWVLGELPTAPNAPPFTVVVAKADAKGQVWGALATRTTVDRWRPRHALVVGIAGGIAGHLALGDVVLATQIWAYEIGHLGARFQPDEDLLFAPDAALLRAAQQLGPEWREAISATPPTAGVSPDVVSGVVASGSKVVETTSSAFFGAVVGANPRVIAVEMEGAGAAAAIAEATEAGHPTGFLMVRSISDLVRPEAEGADPEAPVARNPDRDLWKRYASDVAASFAAELVRSAWPVPPR